MRGTSFDIVVSCGHEIIVFCGIYMVFKGRICCLHIHGLSMENKSCSVVFLLCVLLVYAVTWDLYVNYLFG